MERSFPALACLGRRRHASLRDDHHSQIPRRSWLGRPHRLGSRDELCCHRRQLWSLRRKLRLDLDRSPSPADSYLPDAPLWRRLARRRQSRHERRLPLLSPCYCSTPYDFSTSSNRTTPSSPCTFPRPTTRSRSRWLPPMRSSASSSE